MLRNAEEAMGCSTTMQKRTSSVWSKLGIVLVGVAMAAALLITGCSASDDAADSTTDSTTDSTADEANNDATDEEASADESSENTQDAQLLATPSSVGALQVVDGRLADSSGNPVQLRGISTHGLAWFPEYVNEACISELNNWGANLLRLVLYTDESDGYCTGGDQGELKDAIRSGVEYASQADMYAIIDWHVLSEGTPTTYQSEAETFFDEMSKEFADQDNVLYEICNEPNTAEWGEIKSYAEDIIPIIRENDPDAIIIVGTPTWSQDVDVAANDPIEDYDNIMYTLHFYAATHKDDLRDRAAAAADAGLPIFVTEFGICDASGSGDIDVESADAWIDLLDTYGISYAIWNLSNKDETSSLIKADVSKTSDFTYDDLSESGQWMYDLLSSKAGDAKSN